MSRMDKKTDACLHTERFFFLPDFKQNLTDQKCSVKFPSFNLGRTLSWGSGVDTKEQTDRHIGVMNFMNIFLKILLRKIKELLFWTRSQINNLIYFNFIYHKYFSLLSCNISLKFWKNLLPSDVNLYIVTYYSVQVVHLIFSVRSRLAIWLFCTERCCINKPSFGIWLPHCVHQ